jgi:signal transduction histidine kinase
MRFCDDLRIRQGQARRMQMVGSLARGIAHNFNNIISAILGYSEIVEATAHARNQVGTAYR